MIHGKLEMVQVVLIYKAFIKFEDMPKRYVKNLMYRLESKGSIKILKFL